MTGTAASPDDVRALVHGQLARAGVDPAALPDDLDLLAGGVVDSFGLLELIDELERAFGVVLDLETADPDDATTVAGLARHVAALRGGPVAPRAVPNRLRDVSETSQRRDAPPHTLRRALGRAALGVYRGAARARDKLFSLATGGAFASFGRRSVLQLPLRVKGEQRIAIGDGCFVGAGSWLQAIGDGDQVALTVGDGASIAGACVISAVESVRIGARVSFARGVYIADHAHDYAGDAEARAGVLADVRPVEIGAGVWLGENVVVLPGTRIGERAVVGANSVVSGDVPAYSLALGAPARVVHRFDRA